jgi:predicted dehydrogenase
MANKTKIGIIGCGNISDIYLKNCSQFQGIQVVACADLLMERAQAKAEKFNIRAMTVDEILADADIEIIINLTIPKVHADINLRALNAGKHAYSEKPLGVTRLDGQKTLLLASQKKLRVGSAPDTFLGAGLQTCRKLIDDGAIGVPVAATAFMLGHGPENWHPDPEFFYKVGGGPMFDMGPYYLTALVNLLGPVKRVTGSTRISFPERVVGSQPKKGQKIAVETPTHLVGVLEFANGAIGNIITSFDVWHHNLPNIEIYGSEGSLRVPDPNTFHGPVLLRKAEDKEWKEMPCTHPNEENSRGLGVADMAQAIRSGRAHRASGDLAYHVLDLMHSVHDASRLGKHIDMEIGLDRPAAFPVGLKAGHVDD